MLATGAQWPISQNVPLRAPLEVHGEMPSADSAR